MNSIENKSDMCMYRLLFTVVTDVVFYDCYY
jgi:hypothetical protein